MADHIIDTSLAVVELSADGIVRLRIKPGSKLTVASFREVFVARRAISGGVRRGVIAFVPDDMDFEIQVVNMDHYADDDAASFTAAFAIVTSASLYRRLLSLYISYFKPAFPTGAFSDEASALEWVRQHLQA